MMKNWTWFGLYNLLPQKTLMIIVVLLVEMLRLCVAVFTGFTIDALTRAHEIRWGILGTFAWLFLFESALIAITYLREVVEARAFAIFDRTVFAKYWESVVNIDIDAFMRIPIGAWMGKLSYDIKMVCSAVKHSFCVVFPVSKKKVNLSFKIHKIASLEWLQYYYTQIIANIQLYFTLL